MDLTTNYLGLKLANPFMPGASPLTDSLDTARALEANGAAAIVLHSLFEEHISTKPVNRECYEKVYAAARPDETFPCHCQTNDRAAHYLNRIARFKRGLKVPVIASINCAARGTWVDHYASLIEDAGADALELSVYSVSTDPNEVSAEVEKRLIDLVAAVRERVTLPLAVKLLPFYSALPNLARQLRLAGANGLVIFNRSYQPDIDVRTRSIAPRMWLSHVSEGAELRLRLRWLAILSHQTQMSLAISGGVHTGLDALKAVMAGAQGVQVVSALLNAGPSYMSSLLEQFKQQMTDMRVESVEEIRGSMNLEHAPDASADERGHYVDVLHDWQLHEPFERHGSVRRSL